MMSSGTLHTPRDAYDTKRGDTIKNRVLNSYILFRPTEANDPVNQILMNVKYDTARMCTILSKHMRLKL